MRIDLAIAALDQPPPDWLRLFINDESLHDFEKVKCQKRRAELMWSRGMRGSLMDRNNQQPELGKTGEFMGNRSSIAHDRKYCAVAVGGSKVRSIGVDVQSRRSRESCLRIAETWFPRKEYDEICTSENEARFLSSWVVKESWAKCYGKSIFEASKLSGLWAGQVNLPEDESNCTVVLADTMNVKHNDKALNFAMALSFISERDVNVPFEIHCHLGTQDRGLIPFPLHWKEYKVRRTKQGNNE